jgi:hypothetical protein
MARPLSPAVAIWLAKLKLPSSAIKATGPKGHLLKGDVLLHAAALASSQPIKLLDSKSLQLASFPILTRSILKLTEYPLYPVDSELPESMSFESSLQHQLHLLVHRLLRSKGYSDLLIQHGVIPDPSTVTADCFYSVLDSEGQVTFGLAVDAAKWAPSRIADLMESLERVLASPKTLLLYS